jgi:hypothetical protein
LRKLSQEAILQIFREDQGAAADLFRWEIVPEMSVEGSTG